MSPVGGPQSIGRPGNIPLPHGGGSDIKRQPCTGMLQQFNSPIHRINSPDPPDRPNRLNRRLIMNRRNRANRFLPMVLLAGLAWSISGCAVYPAPYGGYYARPAAGYGYAAPAAPAPAPAYVYGPPVYYGPPVIGGIGINLGGGGWHHWR